MNKIFGVDMPSATLPLSGAETTSVMQGGVLSDCTVQDIANKAPAPAWGGIGGTLASQTDLQTSLDARIVGPISATADNLPLFDGATGKLLKNGPSVSEVRQIPQNSQSAAYSLVLADAGRHIYHPSSDTTARIWTIPANASVAFPIGTAITFVNDTGAGAITIAITTDTMVLAGSGSTGSRTLAANGIATALKIGATRWQINGTGLT